MDKTRHAGLINQHLGGHAAKLEQVDFLPVELEHAGFRVGQANKGQGFFLPVGRKTFGIFGADHYNGNVARYKLVIVLAQLRHMLLAEWSDKGAVENQQHVFLAAQISQAEDLA